MGDFERFKEDWRKLNKEESEKISLYMKDWYWDAVCDSDKEWQVVCNYNESGEIESAFPFKYTKRRGLFFIELPWQVACAGIWYRLDVSEISKGKALQYLREQIGKLMEQLPLYDCFRVIFNHTLWTWHPFYWLGFDATPYYTSVIRTIAIDKGLKSNISKRRMREINSGARKYTVEINQITPDEYWEFFCKSYELRELIPGYRREQFVKLITNALTHDACEIRMVKDQNNDYVAGNIVLKDKARSYDQFFTYIPGQGNDAQSIATLSAIEDSLRQGRDFDFEGSMIQGVCEFYTSWNPEYELNYLITKTSKRYDKLRALHRLLKN